MAQISVMPQPKYKQVYEHIVNYIGEGRLQPGDQLPTVRSLASEFDTSPTTIQRAYMNLERDAYTESTPNGYVVSHLASNPTPQPTSWKAFWSYAHRDDELTDGAVKRLIESIRNRFEFLTGNVLGDFKDEDNIAWGDNWRQIVDANLKGTVFFIPIISPTYLRRPECLRELRTAHNNLTGAGLEEGIYPIALTDISSLVDNIPDDSLARLLSDTQAKLVKDSFMLPNSNQAYQQMVNEITEDLIRMSEPLEVSQAALDNKLIERIDDASRNGILEQLELLEDVPNHLQGLAGNITENLDTIQAILSDGTNSINKLNKKDSIKGRIAIVGRISHDLTKPTDILSENCTQFLMDVDKLDQGLAAYYELCEMVEIQNDQNESAVSALRIKDLCTSAYPMLDTTETFDSELQRYEGLSRSLRKPIASMRRACASLLSTREYFQRWERDYC